MQINKTLFLAFTTAILFANISSATNQYTRTQNTTGATGVKCMGVNACRGQSACRSAANACKGQNSCKHRGWSVVQTEKECRDMGGTVIENSD